MSVEFKLETRIAAPIEEVFAMSLSIDEHLASVDSSGERAIGGVTSGEIGLGETVTWRARHFGIPWTMTSKITELDRPRRFVDEQQRGPFRRFRHVHTFEESDGVTVMRDEIAFRAPLGPLGSIAERAVLGWHLPRLITERNSHLRSKLEAR